MRINPNAWGPHLDLETQVKGNDPRVEALAELMRKAKPAEGFYDLRLCDCDHLVAVYRIKREALLATLEPLGVPTDDPDFSSRNVRSTRQCPGRADRRILPVHRPGSGRAGGILPAAT